MKIVKERSKIAEERSYPQVYPQDKDSAAAVLLIVVISSCPAVLIVLFGPWPGHPAWCPWPASPGCWSWPGDFRCWCSCVLWPVAARLPPLGHHRIWCWVLLPECIYCVPTWTLSWFIPNWGQLPSNIYLFCVCGYLLVT